MAKNRSTELSDLQVQLKMIAVLLAAPLKDKLQQKELIRMLDFTGASDVEIAEVLGTTGPTVAVTKARLKKVAGVKKTTTPTIGKETE